MPTYKVVEQCYIPIGEGTGVKYKRPGQLVTLSAQEAKNLDGYVELVEAPVSVRNPDTGVAVRKPDTPAVSKPRKAAGVTIDEEVDSDASGPDQVAE